MLRDIYCIIVRELNSLGIFFNKNDGFFSSSPFGRFGTSFSSKLMPPSYHVDNSHQGAIFGEF